MTEVVMKLSVWGLILFVFAFVSFSCQSPPTTLTEAQKTVIADSAKAVVQLMLTNADKLDFVAYFDHYSADKDARYIENGLLYPSLEAMGKAYAELSPIIESLKVTADAWDMAVLGSDAVAITMPLHFTFKSKGLPEYEARAVWTGIVQRRSGKWTIIQCHESWLNPQEVMAALMPPPPKQTSRNR